MTLSRLPDRLEKPEFYDGVPLKRLIAWGLDLSIVLVISVLAAILTFGVGFFFFFIIFAIVDFLYRWMTLSGTGATWGMRIMAIELHEADGQPLSSGSALLHTGAYLVAGAIFPLQLVSVALMISTRTRQGLGDLLLNTAMINRPARYFTRG